MDRYRFSCSSINVLASPESKPNKVRPFVYDECSVLTPRHRFRQLDPSLFLNGQTTSLLASDAEKELVNEFLGGMPPGACGSGDRLFCSQARAVRFSGSVIWGSGSGPGSGSGIYRVGLRTQLLKERERESNWSKGQT